MDKQTRKTNFKKLQQPATTTKLRATRSSKATTATMTLSEYFNAAENSSNTTNSDIIEPLQDELCAEPNSKTKRESQDIEQPVAVKPKKAPKLKSSSSQRRAGRGGSSGRSKKQPSISEFLRNEQLFAEVTAQHCIVDNFSPDDIEMALALSKSEAEKHGVLRLNDTGDEQDEVVNLVAKQNEPNTESIRRKLQKYGFRTAAKEDYNMLSLAVLPGGKGKRRKHCRWANKFTPLTLRNPEEQLKKLNRKIAEFLAQQVRTKLPSDNELKPLELVSTRMQQIEAKADSRITREPSEGPIDNLSNYYVEELFEVSRTPAHHLLKNWATIQGRDLSPERAKTQDRRHEQQLEKIYAELETYFGDQQQISSSAEQLELDDLEKLVADNMIQDTTQMTENLVNELSPIKEPPDKRARRTIEAAIDNEMQNTQPSMLLETKTSESDIMQSSASISSSSLCMPTQNTRCTSPDLFADSDEETAHSDMLSFSLKVYKNIANTELNSYEVYSSDEAKTVKVEATSTKAHKNFIDLTEELDSPELTMNTTLSRKSLSEQDIFRLSPNIETDQQIDNALTTEDDQDCAISDELHTKYAYKTVQHNKKDFNLSASNQTPTSNSSFNLSFNSAKSIETTSFHSNQNSLKETKNSFQRSFSLTQTDQSDNHLEHSFKSPLSRKSISFTQRSIKLSSFSHSDASIDLTEDSNDDDEDNDDEGVLLSDDEINYSIWKADKTCRAELEQPLIKRNSMPYFKTVDDLDAYLDSQSTVAAAIESSNSRSPNKSALSKERAEFGILDAAHSQSFTLSQGEASQIHIDWNEASFLDTQTELPLKRYSSTNHKFKELLENLSTPVVEPIELTNSDDELDEFDRLVFQNTRDTSTHTVPSGLDRLLNGEINLNTVPQPATLVKTAQIVKPATKESTFEQLEVNGQVFNVHICDKPKPDFINLTEAELMQYLYNYGIKPLKRKQAIKLLEFIYNQTHPIMLPPEEEPRSKDLPLPRSKSTPVVSRSSNNSNARLLHTASTECLTPTETDPQLNQKFRNACGMELLRFSQGMPPGLCDDFEFYVLQTNVTKKTPQPLLPLHIAWHNLLCANPSLHESVLMYVPIDLQEIYMYFKEELGHRYDPKDLKCFFDRRCIVFRYELAPPTKQVQRHVGKKPRKPNSRF